MDILSLEGVLALEGSCQLTVLDRPTARPSVHIQKININNRIVVDDGDIGIQETTPTSSFVYGDFAEVALRPRNRASRLRIKELADDVGSSHSNLDRISLCFDGVSGPRTVCVVAGTQLRLGRQKSKGEIDANDIVIRPMDRGDCTRISRQHAVVTFADGGAIFSNTDSCKNGSVVSGAKLGPAESTRLSSNAQISLAGAVAIAARVRPPAAYFRLSDYTHLVDGRQSRSNTILGRHQSLVLRREDSASDEEYVLFQRVLTIGRGPHSDIRIAHRSVAIRHCYLHFLNGQFWIEPVQVFSNTAVNGIHPRLDQLVGVDANTHLTIGEVEVEVTSLQQPSVT
ncbi:FHA domain-containing protein [Botrimarina hoheduenensis]|uniref:FHA domain-containing protein n=1 Tax=Botrimarina hoheduenensis TaxID=2528000 RepID=UPI0011B45B3A|nr:FHA domain-containing protein [Botrimarina hoheduenensis]